MAETLYIRLGSRYQNKIHWLITSAQPQEIIASGELASAELLTELTDKALTRKVIVLVPSSDVALKSLLLPNKSLRAKKQVVPYMLEEELAQPVEELFFAYANVKETEQANCFVAVVEKQQIEQWLQWLQEANISTLTMLPDVLAMPLEHVDVDKDVNSEQDTKENHQPLAPISVLGFDEQFLVRQTLWQGMLVEAPVWQLYCQRLPADSEIHYYSPIDIANDTVKRVEKLAELPMYLLAQHVKSAPLNLLQGQFVQKKKSNQLWKTWRLAASLALVTLLVGFAGKGVELYQLNTQKNALEADIQALYQKNFAAQNSKQVSVNRIRSLVTSKLKSLAQQGQGESFLPLVEKITPSFAAVNTLTPESFKFDHKRREIRIQASAKSYQDFERFKTSLEQANLEVSQGSQNNNGDSITGSFSIKDAS